MISARKPLFLEVEQEMWLSWKLSANYLMLDKNIYYYFFGMFVSII